MVDPSREQERLLLHDAHGLAQRCQRDVANILPVDGNSPGFDVVITPDEVRDGGFAAAWRADNADGLAGSDLQVDAAQRALVVGPGGVAEIDRFESQHTVADF